jgi:Zn ribbon nucleic-acid-binding protein
MTCPYCRTGNTTQLSNHYAPYMDCNDCGRQWYEYEKDDEDDE